MSVVIAFLSLAAEALIGYPNGLFRADVAPGAAVPDLPRSAATR